MPFRKKLHISTNEDDEEYEDDEEAESKVSVLFPGSRVPSIFITPNLARELTGRLPSLRLKIKSKLKELDLFRIKK